MRVACECNQWLQVAVTDTGSQVKCPCGRRVEVPLIEEFHERSDLLSAATLERRIQRLLRTGDLPIVGQCVHCGDRNVTEVVPVRLNCEQSSVQFEGGLRFLYIPFLFTIVWREEERAEVRGRDTDISTPICLCPACQVDLRAGDTGILIGVVLLSVVLVLLLGYVHLLAGVILAFVAPLAILAWRYRAYCAREERLKNLLRRVPLYRQVLAEYPGALVEVPWPKSAPGV